MTIISRALISLMGLFLIVSNAVAAPPPAEGFGVLPAIYDAAISPDGQQIASIVNIQGSYVVRVAKLDQSDDKLRLVRLGEGVKPWNIRWVNKDRVLVSLWQSDKIRGTPITVGYIYTLDTVEMKGKILVKPKDMFRQFNHVVVDWLEDDPDHILMAFSEDSNTAPPDLRRVNVRTGRNSVVKRALSNVQTWYTDTRGEPRVGQGRRDNKDADWVLRIRDADGDKWHFANEYPGLKPDVDIYGFTLNPNELIISDYRGKDTLGLYVYDLGVKSITRKIYHDDNYDVNGIVMSNDGSEVIGAKYTADADETVLLPGHDSVLNRLRRKLDAFTISYVDQTQDGGITLVKASNPYTPGSLMMIRSGDDMPTNLGNLYPHLKSDDLGIVTSVKYTARDGQKIPAFVTLPPKVTSTAMLKDLPFIVLPHGGPYGRDAKRFDYFAQFFASRGYGVLQMNFRGSEGYGKSFEEAGRQNWVVMQEDVEDGTKWLLEKGYADPERTCIAGWSYGGYAALMGAAKNSELYNCAIAMAALTDIKDFMRDRRRYQFGRASVKNFIGNGFEDKDDIKANSPVKIAEDMTVPLFLAHGTQDQRVHFDQYRRMKSALKKSKAKVTYMEFKDEDHFLSNQAHRQKFFKGLDKFLRQNNGESEFSN